MYIQFMVNPNTVNCDHTQKIKSHLMIEHCNDDEGRCDHFIQYLQLLFTLFNNNTYSIYKSFPFISTIIFENISFCELFEFHSNLKLEEKEYFLKT